MLNRVAVVILNFNGRDWLRNFLPSVIRYSPSSTIVVADNCSTDGSAEMVAAEFPGINWIQITENLGFCGGYNFALKKVESEFYVLLNSDVEVTEGWLGPIIERMIANPRIGAAQPKILAYQNKLLFEYAGAAGGFIDALGYPFCRGRLFETVEEDKGQYNDSCPVFWATGACLVVRSELYHKLGGLDEDFFAHMEEIDFCWKLHRAGYEVLAVGECRVYHVGGATLSKSNPHKTYLNFRNGLSLIFKHMTAGELLWKGPMRILLDWGAAFMFLVGGSGRNAAAVVRAHFHFLLGWRKDYRKRRAFGQLSKSTGPRPIYPRSIVIDYFLLKRKSFRDLRF